MEHPIFSFRRAYIFFLKLSLNSFWLSAIIILCISCNHPTISIHDLSNTRLGQMASAELRSYLQAMYKDVHFSTDTLGKRPDILYLLTSQAKEHGMDNKELPEKTGSYNILYQEESIYMIAPDDRGFLNATYALLEKLGCGFYLSGDLLPEPTAWDDFSNWEMADEPLVEERFVFNWHNFLSGCTGWNHMDWQKWIDQASKMRYNGIMVHAYGNNPMFSFEYKGEKKATGYLNNTRSGRDWGNQHINDVRKMAGGHIFQSAVYGAKASKTPDEDKEKEATILMQKVFQHAEERGMKVIIALDFDTWMANPRNIIEKLPDEAVFELGEGHLAVNPEHPEGYAYYEQILRSLRITYPQIDQLSVWHRRPSRYPGLGSIWMNFPYSRFPEHWKLQYRDQIRMHPELSDDLRATSMFAYGELIRSLQKARDRVWPDLQISSGSWRFQYVKFADAFFPEDVPLLPLDWEIVFDQEEARNTLSTAGSHRDIYPIIWAHHDDHRYIGRPYSPWKNLPEMLEERNSKGFGIIHWTTRPLDLYFTNSARQVWRSTKNETEKQTVEKYVMDLIGEKDDLLSGYFLAWWENGPMFGRETTDHFIDLGTQQLGHEMETWEGMKGKTRDRVQQLNRIPGIEDKESLMYFKQMEQFYLSFFDNQILFQEAYERAEKGQSDEAIRFLKRADPEKTIELYASAIANNGFTRGEKALVFSMNTRWLADFYNLEQRLCIRPVRFLFSETKHDPLAQAPGHYTYFIDEQDEWWRCLWKDEMPGCEFTIMDGENLLLVEEPIEFQMETWHGQSLPGGRYRIHILTPEDSKPDNVMVEQTLGGHMTPVRMESASGGFSGIADLKDGSVLTISSGSKMFIKGMVIRKE